MVTPSMNGTREMPRGVVPTDSLDATVIRELEGQVLTLKTLVVELILKNQQLRQQMEPKELPREFLLDHEAALKPNIYSTANSEV